MSSPQKCFWAAIGALVMLTSAASYADGDSPSLEERCRREVVELHQFLEDWSNAALPPTEEAYLRFAEVIAPSFLLIDPDGSSVTSGEVLEAIRNAHGRWSEAPSHLVSSPRLNESQERGQHSQRPVSLSRPRPNPHLGRQTYGSPALQS